MMVRGGRVRDAGGGHGWPTEVEPGASQQRLLDDKPTGKPPKRAPRNGQRWKILLDKFADGAGDMFVRDDKLVDRGTIVGLNRLVDELRAAEVTQAEVRQAGEYVAEHFAQKLTARWLLKPGNLMDLIAKGRAGGAQVAGKRKFKVR